MESSGLQGIDWEVPKFEIGYWCRTRFTGRGYITEAVLGITAFAFDTLGARRAGFLLEGELRNNELGADGEPRDILIYALTPADARNSMPVSAARAVSEPPLQA